MALGNQTFAHFDATMQNNMVMFDISSGTDATVQIVQERRVADGITATFTLERSNDAAHWYSLATPTTLTPDNITSSLDIAGYQWLRVRVSTAATDSLNSVMITAAIKASTTSSSGGTSGYSGYSGYSGKSGYSGYSGKSGYSGYSGYSGISGYSGYSGISGYSGYSGYSGVSGYSGNSFTTGEICCSFDGGSGTPLVNTKAQVVVPFGCTITSATIIADQTGSAVVDVKKSTYANFPTTASIAASAKPTLSSAQKNQDSTLTGWTTSITSGDVVEFNLDSVTTCNRVQVYLAYTKT